MTKGECSLLTIARKGLRGNPWPLPSKPLPFWGQTAWQIAGEMSCVSKYTMGTLRTNYALSQLSREETTETMMKCGPLGAPAPAARGPACK